MSYLLPHLIDRAAESEPDRDAFRCYDRQLSYSELLACSNALAHLLIEHGVEPGERVGIFMPRCLESAVAVYGIMKTGAAFVPIDPATPLAALRHVINDCGIRHLTAHHTLQQKLEPVVTEPAGLELIVGLDSTSNGTIRTLPWHTIEQFPHGYSPERRTTDQDLAYIIYTSGSTGRPKGIMHTHYSGMSYAKLSAGTYDLRPDDCIGSHSPLHFDMSTFGYFSAPYAAATTVLIPEAHTKFPASLSELVEIERISIWYSVPFALIQLLTRGVLDRRDLSELRWVLFGGEPFPPKYLRALMAAWPHARFSNVYGPAEVNQCTYFHLPPLVGNRPSDAKDEKSIPIGKVWDQTEALVLDEHDERVSVGHVGELLIRSPTMMRGYWARPDLDAIAFYRQAVSPNTDRVFYRTGDLVRLEPDGNYQFLGRKDRQIKARGHRVELDEIEAVLASHAQVEEAVAFSAPDGEGSNHIHAAVTTVPEATITSIDLATHVRKRLPWYAVPTHIAIEKSLPRTATGKINRRQLQTEALAASRVK